MKNSSLTGKNFQEFNKRNAKHCSPYYKGLTDCSLDILRRAQSAKRSARRERHATSYDTNSSFRSNLIVNLHEWSSSCLFISRGGTRCCRNTCFTTLSLSPPNIIENGAIITKGRMRMKKNSIELERKRVITQFTNNEGVNVSSPIEKPYENKESETLFMLPLSPPMTQPKDLSPYPLPHISPPPPSSPPQSWHNI